MLITITTLLLTVAILLWLIRDASKLRRRFKTTADYFLWGDEDLSATRFAGTFTSSNVTFTSSFLAVSATGYLLGGQVVWLILSFIGGLLLFGFLYKRTIAPWVAEGEIGSMHEFLERSYGRGARRIGAVNTVVSFIGTIALELLGIQLVLESISPVRPPTGLVLVGFFTIGALILWYTTVGGFREVVRSDLLQAVVMFAGIAAMTVAMLFMLAQDSALTSTFVASISDELSPENADPIFIISMAILFLPFQFCLMDMWQRCRATRAHPQNVRTATLWSTPLATIPLIIAAALGILLRHVDASGGTASPTNENMAFFGGFKVVLASLEAIGPFWAGVMLVAVGAALLMAAISTVDTLMSSIAYTTLIDLWADRRKEDDSESLYVLQLPINKTIHIIAGLSILVGIIGAILTIFRWSLYDMALAIFGSQVSFAVPLALAFFFPKVAKRVRPIVPWALAVGLVTPIVAVILGRRLGIPDLVSGAPLVAFSAVTGMVLAFLLATVFRRKA